MSFYVYMLELENGAFYTGSTSDLNRRWKEHATGRGARTTRMIPPVRILTAWSAPDRSTAMRLEAAIKKLRRPAKEELIEERGIGRRFGLEGIRRISVPKAAR